MSNSMSSKRFTFVLAIVTLISVLSVTHLLVASPDMGGVRGEIIIGLDLALTGKYAEPYGLPMQRGFELTRDELNQLNGPQITFITEDDMSTVEGAVKAFNKLIHQHGVSIIAGLAVSRLGAQAFPVAQENGVVCLSPVSSAAGLSAIGDFVFRISLATDVQHPIGVRITQEKLGYQKVALIYDDADLYSTSSNEELNKALAASGVEILITETFQGGDTNFSAQLTRIMETNPDALFISALSREIAGILTQRRVIGMPDSVRFIIPDLTEDEAETAGDAAEGAIAFIGWTRMMNTPGNQAFVQNYRAKYGLEPEPWAAQSYVALYILAEAISKAQSTEATAVRDAMANITDLDTILGQFAFNADGDAVYDPTILIVENGVFVPLE